MIRLVLCVMLSLLMCCSSTTPALSRGAPGKKALLVAIDAYGKQSTPDVPDDQQWKALAGTKHDVVALTAELERRGFDVKVLKDSEATRQGIVDAFKTHLIEGVRPGKDDMAWFHYSGHGQQVPDDNGAADERDGYDEALVPFDNKGLEDYSNHLRDDVLGELLDTLRAKTANIVVSLDSCHSGTGTRSDSRSLRGAMPMHAPAATRGGGDDGIASNDKGGMVLLAAAQPHEYAGEARVGGKVMGAFTYLLVQALRDATKRTTFRDLIDRIGVRIVSLTSKQTPAAEGDVNRKVFAKGWVDPPAYYRVRPAGKDGRIPVEAGTIHGLGAGSVLGVYPLGARAMDPEKPKGKLELKSVELGMSYGVLTADSKIDASFFAKGAQGIELIAVAPLSPLRLNMGSGVGDLAGVVDSLRFVVRADAVDADVRLEASAGALTILRTDGSVVPFPRGEEQPLDPQLPMTTPNLGRRLRVALESEYRKNRLAMMENRDNGTRLDVRLSVHKVDAVLENGVPVIKKDHGAVAKHGTGRLSPGDVVQLRVENKSSRAAYFTVLGLNPDGSINALYPQEGAAAADAKIEAGQSRTIAQPFLMTEPAGTQFFKLLSSESYIDFTRLKYEVETGAQRGAKGTLAQMMEGMVDANRAKPFGYTKKERWGADTARIQIGAP